MKKGFASRLVVRRDALAFDGVERAQPNGPPTAFRIWKSGLNVTDHGPTIFSDRSASILLAQQELRGNLFPIDIDHLSLNVDAPLEARRAVGWFRIEVRDGDLWAADVEWTDTVRAGLTKEPPEWRYHSPAYDQDPETDEVISLLNLAITNLPATHSVTALASCGASRKGNTRMNLQDIKAALAGADEEKKAAAWRAIAAAMASSASEDEPEKKDGEDEPEKKDEPKDEPDEKKDSEDEPEKKDSDDGEDEKKDAASIAASALAEVQRLASKVQKLEKAKEKDERAALLASRPDFAPELVAILASAPIEMLRKSCKTLPKTLAAVTTETVQATRGEGQGDGKTSRLPAEEKRALDERMGIRRRDGGVKHEGVHSTFHVMTAEEARRALNGGK